MRFERHPAVMLSLAALYQIAEDSKDGPVAPTLTLRAVLALLHALSNGDRTPYESYWRECRNPHASAYSETERRYLRPTMTITAWNGIVRSLGITADIAFMERIHQMVHRSARMLADRQCQLVNAAQPGAAPLSGRIGEGQNVQPGTHDARAANPVRLGL